MLNNVKKIIALVLALAMIVALVGCSKGGEEMSSGGVIYVDNEILVDENGNPITGNNAADGNNDVANNDNVQSTTDNKKDPNPSTGAVNPEDYRGTEVVFATTILSSTDESGPVVDAFEKKYGITVKEILVGDNVNEIAGKLASGTNIDVMRTCSDFPAAMAVLQPLTAAKLDMTDPIWNKSIFEYTTFGGEPYCCDTTNNVWTENACVVYSKSLLERANCATPEEYDALGKWTWDAYAAIAKAVDSIDGLGKGIRGTYIDDGYLLASAGFQLYKFKDGKFSNGLKDPEHAVAFSKIATWNKEGFITNSVVDPFVKGNTGIVCGLGWSLKKTGSNKDYPNWKDIGFYYLPAYKEGMKPGGTAMFKAWGLCRGSENPEGAGLFLRYYLDAGNYDTQGAFITPEAERFFFKMTEGISMENFHPQFTSGSSTEGITGFFEWDWDAVYLNDPSQVSVKLSAMSDSVDKAVDTLNKFVSKNTGIRE